MKCEVCDRTVSEHGVTLHRVNPTGQKGIWRCDKHLTDDQRQAIDQEVAEVVGIIEQNNMTPTPNQVEPSRERVEEVAEKMYSSLFPGENHWPNTVNDVYWRTAAAWHLTETAALTQQLTAAQESIAAWKSSHDIWEQDYKLVMDALGIDYANGTEDSSAGRAIEAINTLQARILELESQCGEKDAALKLCDENEDYFKAIDQAKAEANRCKDADDMYGYNFFSGICHGIIQQQIPRTVKVRAALANTPKDSQ